MAEVLQFPATLDETLAFSQANPGAYGLHPPDTPARAQALDITASWIVEAPAGSGKTGLLMQRFLKLLAAGRVSEPEEVLAITFTRKATAELRERLLAQLASAASAIPLRPDASGFDRLTRSLAAAALARDSELGWRLLDHPERLNIRTIDSVCGEIARTLPLLSGGGGARTPTDNPEALYRRAARRTLGQLGGPDRALHEALRTVLLHRDANLADCETLLAGMLGTRDQWGRLLPLGPGEMDDDALETVVRPRLERALEEVVCSALSTALRQLPVGVLDDLTVLARRSGSLPGYRDQPSPVALCADRARPPEARAADLDHWVALVGLLFTKDGTWRRSFAVNALGFKPSKADEAVLRDIVFACCDNAALGESLCALRDLPPAHYPDAQWVVVKALFRLLRHALAELKLLFAEERQCDFAELSLAATEALGSPDGSSDFARAAGVRLRHLLVDEMQDTSSSQYELLDLLTTGWGGEGETLFLVGDPKQSIYLFRQARVERFLRTVATGHLTPNQPGPLYVSPLQLTANFRSQGQLVADFNSTFASIFPAHGTLTSPSEVPFVAAGAIRPPTPSAELHWHTAILGEEDLTAPTTGDPKLDHTLEEARSIRRTVELWQARPLPPNRSAPWRIAVLARTREHLAPVIAEFSRPAPDGKTIPFRAVDIDALVTRPEVLDALALTRALLHPADRVAWLAVLHAPWCGLGLADLLALTGEGAAADPHVTITSLIETRRTLLSPLGQRLLARTAAVLGQALSTLGRTSFAVHVERTWLTLGGDASLPPEALGNVRRFFAVLRETEAEGGGRVDLPALSMRLRRLFAEPRPAEGAVELMTIHKSKGLEWDVVLVPGLERKPRGNTSSLLNWAEMDGGESAEAAHVVLAPIYGKGEDSDKLNTWLRSVLRRRELAEGKRLFYVACTRAREELHLFGACTRKSSGDLAPPTEGTLLRACWGAAEPLFQSAAATPTLLPGTIPSFQPESPGVLALAASADTLNDDSTPRSAAPPLLRRLPLDFDPGERFRHTARLPYIEASALSHGPRLPRPEGSFSARAFGNVVHRFLAELTVALAAGRTPHDLRSELSSWRSRLHASLRGEGLSPALSAHEAERALDALRRTLDDATGRWLLSPHPGAANEFSLNAGLEGASFRADRTFSANASFPGDVPSGTEQVLWIVDFKTAEQGARQLDAFTAMELGKYRPQMESYAAVRRSLAGSPLPIHLGLYYPLAGHFLHWKSVPTL